MAHAESEAVEQGRGLRVILILAVLTVLEYLAAVALRGSSVGLLAVLAPIGVVKAWFIVMYFMHLGKVWNGEGEAA